MVEKASVLSQEDSCHSGRCLITLTFQADKPVLNTSCLFLLQEWFKLRNAQWRQAEGLPAKLGSVLD